MTSKISFSKFVKEDIRHRGWLAVLSFILLLLSETVFAMLILDAFLTSDEFSSMAMELDEVRKVFPGLLNGNCSAALEVILFFLAVLCAVTGFSYLHSPEKTDFYHSFPFSRTQWFSISYVSGLMIFLIPYLVSSFLTILAGARYKTITTAVLGKSLLAVFGGILAFLLIYHVAILAMMLTGKIVTGVLAALALSVYGSMAGGLGYNMALFFFETCSGQGYEFYEKFSSFLSPFAMFSQLIADTSGYDGSYAVPTGIFHYIQRFLRASGADKLPILLIYTVFFLAVIWSVSLLLYKKRPSEVAGSALAYPRTAPVIKVLVSIPTALYIGILIGTMYNESTKWISMISILSAILLCGLIEFIYHMDLRRLFAGKYSSLISIAGVAAVLCMFQFDLIGYDTWFPEENALESMSFEIGELYNYFSYPSDMVYNSYDSRDPDFLNGDEGQIYDFKPVYELAREGVENIKKGVSRNDIYSQDISGKYVSLTVRYNKKSGKPVYRNYAVQKETALAALDSLCKEEDYRKSLFPVFHIDADDITAIRLTDIYQESDLMNLSQKQQEELLELYKKDILKVDMNKLQNEPPIGELSVDIPEGNSDDPGYTITVPGLYLYEGFENTLALLEEYGYTIRRAISPDDVELMKYIGLVDEQTMDANGTHDVTSSTTWDTSAENRERVVTDPKEIREILSQINYPCSRLLGRELTTRSVEITFKENTDPYYYPLP